MRGYLKDSSPLLGLSVGRVSAESPERVGRMGSARRGRCGADCASTQFSARPAMERGGCVGRQHVSHLLPLCYSFRAA